MNPTGFMDRFADPARVYSLMPFWFWNDDLTEAELARQKDQARKAGPDAIAEIMKRKQRNDGD